MQKYRNRIIAGFAIGFVIYVVLLLFVNTGDLLQQLTIYPWELLIPVILLKFVAWFCRFIQWHYFLGVIDANDKISRFDSAVLFISGFSMAVSPGKIAEMLKAVVLKTKTGIPIAKSAPVIIAERVMDGIAVLLLAFIAILIARDTIQLGEEYRFVVILSSLLLIFGLIAIQIRPLAYFFLDIFAKLPFAKRLHEPLVTFYESSNEIFKLKHVIIPTLFGMVAAVTDVIGFMIILTGFGIEMNWALFLQTTVIVCLASAIGALSGVPNGAGVTEISVGAMLMAIVAPTNPMMTLPVATAVALVEGFFHKWFRVFVGVGVGVIFRNRLLSPEIETTIAEMEAERAQKRAGLSVETGNV
jgi:glycosyltransferase 2 family protein